TGTMLAQALAYLEAHRERFLQELLEFLAIPSVSARPEHARDVHMAALWLTEHLRHIGLRSEVLRTDGHPVVYAEWRARDPHAPTVLIYGHYDVQPADPFELWDTPPFSPAVRDGYVYARGASDNKGQHFAHVKAVETLLHTQGTLPVNVKFLIEGEEEIGSPSLSRFVSAHVDLLRCDCVMISDSAMRALDQPSLVYGLRGLVHLEVTVRCLAHDVHSGHYGGLVQNPILALAQMLAQVKDEQGRVRIPGFYDDVRALDPEERAALMRAPYTEADLRRETGALAAFGEPEYSLAERRGARPTFEVNGIWGGYTGAGLKTIIPAEAHAKITCRLVPYQDPQRVAERVADYLRNIAPVGTEVEVRFGGGSPAVLIDRHTPVTRAAMRAAAATYGAEPIFELEGGSIPIVADLQRQLGVPIVLLGMGLPDDNVHAPNERFSIRAYERGIQASARFLLEMSACCAGGDRRNGG
ncbi:MAG: dipeptidase, partial [Thermoflexales bacterium]|nr:dipeptidase [Thermoflexales bacterium]